MPTIGETLISQNDGPFKAALDHTKYAVRYPDLDPLAERAKASEFILSLDTQLAAQNFLTGDRPTLADIAIFSFVRQFAHINRAWFDAQPWPHVILWLDGFLQSDDFHTAMTRLPVWEDSTLPYLLARHRSRSDNGRKIPQQEEPGSLGRRRFSRASDGSCQGRCGTAATGANGVVL